MGNRLRNTKHERFAHAVAGLTPFATAYREAGFGGDPRWHPYNASKLANKPAVKQRIEQLRIEFEQVTAIHADYVRHQLLRAVEADVRELYERDPKDPTGKRLRLRSLDKLPRHLAAAISRVKIDPDSGQPVEIILANKTEAAATLLRSLPGGSIERRELTGANGGPLLLDALLHPANLEKLNDAEIEMLQLIAHKLAITDESATGAHGHVEAAE